MFVATPKSKRFTGWYHDQVTPASKLYLNGTLVATVAGNDLTCADKLAVAGTSAFTGVVTAGVCAFPTADGSNTEQLQTDGAAAATVTWESAS